MTPLQRHINSRSLRQAARAARIVLACRSLPAPFTRWMQKRLWPASLRHMCAISEGFWFELTAESAWVMRFGSREIARSVPFAKLIGSLDNRPVTIVASGPSARDFPWDNLRQQERFIIAVNGACGFLHDQGILADLLVVTDAEFPRTGQAHLAKALEVPMVTTCAASSVYASVSPNDLSRKKFAIIERVNAWYGIPALDLPSLADLNSRSGTPFHLSQGNPRKFKVGWSSNPELGFFSGCTVVFAALQVAIGLGANDIEIVGMDLGGVGRSYAEAEDAPPSLLESQYQDYILPSFAIMNCALTDTGISIRNHSTLCPLPHAFFVR